MPSYLCGGTSSMTAAKAACAVFHTSIDDAGVANAAPNGRTTRHTYAVMMARQVGTA